MDFAGNTEYAIRNDSTLLTINAQNLWWGDPSGPTHFLNPGGIGDRVSDYVDFGDVTFLPVIGWHPIKLEFFEQGGGSVITLSYSSTSTPKQIIPSSNLNTASDGSGSPGLNYECYDGINFDIFKSIGIDTSVNFNPADTTLGVNRAGGGDTFSCRWTGYVKLDYDEIYTFYTLSDDGVRLWIDDGLVIDNWTLHGPTENSAQFVKVIVSNYAKKPFGLCSPDKPYDLISTVYGPCSLVPIVDLTWTYNEQTGSPQKGYRVEIDDENTFSDPVLWKSCDPALYCLKEGITTPETFTIGTPTDGTISYNNTYYWRVKVFDQDLEESVWSDTQNFQTFPQAGPQVDRDYSPPKPSVNQPVNFTDTSICYDIFGSYDCISRASPAGAVTYCWDFDWHPGDIGCDSTKATTSFSYTTSGAYNVSQQVTDESGIMCSDFFNINVEFALPTWREIAPF